MPKALELMLYPEDGWTSEKIKATCEAYQSISKYAYILHDQDSNKNDSKLKPHFHLYLNFGNSNVKEADCAKWFSAKINQVARIKARGRNAIYSVLAYYTHRNEPDKHLYDVSAIQGTIDAVAVLQRGEVETRESEILLACADGTITALNYPHHITAEEYTRLETKMQRAWVFRERKILLEQGVNRNLITIFITGKSGSGKTLLAKLYTESLGLDTYITSQGDNPFDGYKGEAAVIWDDFRPSKSFPYEAMLKIMDPFTVSSIHCRYRDKSPNFSLLILTSSISVHKIIQLYDLPPEESPLQFLRRINQIWNIQDDKVIIVETKITKDGYTSSPKEVPNPVPSYIASLSQTQDRQLTVDDTIKVFEKISQKHQHEQLLLFDQENPKGDLNEEE